MPNAAQPLACLVRSLTRPQTPTRVLPDPEYVATLTRALVPAPATQTKTPDPHLATLARYLSRFATTPGLGPCHAVTLREPRIRTYTLDPAALLTHDLWEVITQLRLIFDLLILDDTRDPKRPDTYVFSLATCTGTRIPNPSRPPSAHRIHPCPTTPVHH